MRRAGWVATLNQLLIWLVLQQDLLEQEREVHLAPFQRSDVQVFLSTPRSRPNGSRRTVQPRAWPCWFADDLQDATWQRPGQSHLFLTQLPARGSHQDRWHRPQAPQGQ